MRKRIIVAILLIATLYGCKHEVVSTTETNGGNTGGACDPSVFTYSAAVKPILERNCYGCHSGAAPAAGLDYKNYEVLKSVALSGRLLGAINHRPGFSPMPKGSPKLSACNIEQIAKWANAGALNN